MASQSNQIGLRVAIRFNNAQATRDLEKVLASLDKKFANKNWLTLDTTQISAMTEAMRELANVKINIEGQKESLAYYESVTKQLEKQVKAAERIAKSMKEAGAKELVKQEAAEQKDYYHQSQKLMQSIVQSEKTLLTLTGENKKQMQSIIKDKKEELKLLKEKITNEHYSDLYTQNHKEMEKAITSEKLKQNELTKKINTTEKEKATTNKENERLANAEKAYKRLVEVKTTLYQLDENDPSVSQLKEEEAQIERVINGYKRAKNTLESIKKIGKAADLSYKQNIGLIDSKAYEKEKAKLEKEQQSNDKKEKSQTKEYIDSLARQLKDLYKAYYSTNDAQAQIVLSKKIDGLEAELAIYRELVQWKKTVSKLDREIATAKDIAIAKQIDDQTSKKELEQNTLNKAWSGEYYAEYKKNITEAHNLEKKIREELVKTTGVQADSIQVTRDELIMLKHKGGYLGALAQNLLKVNENLDKYKELTSDSTYNNIVKDHSITEQKERYTRKQHAQEEALLQKQIEQSKTAEELIPLQQRLLTIQLERLSLNKHLTEEQKKELLVIQDLINNLNGRTKSEVFANSKSIKDEMTYQRQLAALTGEQLTLEQNLRLENELREIRIDKANQTLKDLEHSKYAKHLDMERLDAVRELIKLYETADAKTFSSLTQRITTDLSGIKLDAKFAYDDEKIQEKEQSLNRYIELQKDSLKQELQSLNHEELKGHVLESNRQALSKQIEALNGNSKEEVREAARLVQKNIDLEKTFALESQLYSLRTESSKELSEAYFLERSQTIENSKYTATALQNKINELTIGKQLTAQQQEYIDKLQQIQQIIASGNLVSKGELKSYEQEFNREYSNYLSQTKQANQLKQSQDELKIAERLLATNKQKLKDKLELLKIGRNGKFIDEQKLAIAQEMVNTLAGQTTKEVRYNTTQATEYINAMSREANIKRIKATGGAVDSLRNSLNMIAGYFSAYTLVNRFFNEFKEGLQAVQELDSAMATLRMTMTNFTEKDITKLVDKSIELSKTLKTNVSDVLEAVKTVANAEETMDTILNKSKAALIISNLSGVSVGESVNMIQSATRQFKDLEDASEASTMAVADSMIAISKSLGMDFSEGIVGLSEGLSILGSVANQFKMDLNETLSMIASTAETTRSSFSETATALRMIMARTMRVGSLDSSVTYDDMLKTEKALASIGVAIRNLETNEMRGFKEIMSELHDKFYDLDEATQSYVADAMGGAQRLSVVFAMLKSQTRADEFLEIANNSSGTALETQAIWAESLEAKLKDLSNAATIFWQTFIDSNAYHSVIESLTSIINFTTQLVDNFGAFPPVLFAVSAAFTTFNAQLRENISMITSNLIPAYGALTGSLELKGVSLTQSLEKDKASIALLRTKIAQYKELGLSTTYFNTALKAKTSAVKQDTLALIGNTVATTALQAATSLGLSLAISAAIGLFNKMVKSIKTTEERVTDLQDSIASFRETLDAVNKADVDINTYQKANEELKSLTEGTDEHASKLEEIQRLRESIASAGDEYNSILKNTNLTLDEQIKLIKESNMLRLREAAKEFESETKQSTIDNLQELIERQAKQYVEQEATIAQMRRDGLDTLEYYNGTFIDLSDYEKWHEELGDTLKRNYIDLTEINGELLYFEQGGARVSLQIKEVSDGTQAILDGLIGVTDELSDANGEAETFNNTIGKTAEELRKTTEDYVDITKNLKEARELLSKIQEDGMTLDNASQMLNLFEDFTGNITDAVSVQEFLNNKISEMAQTQKDTYKEMIAEDENYWKQKVLNSDNWKDHVNSVNENVKEFGRQILGEESQDFIDFIENRTANRQIDYDNAKTLAQAEKILTSGLTGDLMDYFEDLVNEKNDGRETDYGNVIEFLNQQGVKEAKTIDQLKDLWSKFYQAKAKAIQKEKQDLDKQINTYGTDLKLPTVHGLGDLYKPNQEALTESIDKLQELANLDEEIQALFESLDVTFKEFENGLDLSGVDLKDPTSSSSSSSSSANKVEDLDLQIDRYHDLARAITRVNNALEKNQAAQEHATPKKKLQLMKEEIELYKELRDAQKALYQEQKKEASELKKKLSKYGFTFNDDGTVKNYQKRLEELQKQANKLSGDAKKAKIEEVKALKELVDAYEKLINETLPNTQQEYLELNNTIKDAQREQLEFIADLQSQITDAITEELEKRYDAVRKALEEEKELYEKQHEDEQWEDDFNKEQEKLAEIQAQIDALSRDFSEAGRLKLEQLMKEYKEQQEVIDQMLNDKNHQEGSDRFDEALEELDKELEDALSAENLAEMVNQALTNGFIKLDGEIIKTETLLTNMLENSGDLFLATGQLIQTELIDGLKVAQGLMSDISNLTSSITGRSLINTASYSLTPEVSTRSITPSQTQAPNISLNFDQFLNVEGNLDTTLMLDLESKLRQAMNEVTYKISQALTYR